jgi:hypothetical protein
MPAPPGDSSFWYWLWGAFGGVFGTMTFGFFYLLGKIGENRRDGILLEIEKRFATKNDLDHMERRLSQTMRDLLREHETNVQRDIDMRLNRNHD